MIVPQENTITISPIGILDENLIKGINLEVNRVFGFRTEIERLLDNIDFALDTSRNQYHSTALLEKLADLASPKAAKILAITKVDLFIPILTHVYGRVGITELPEGISLTAEDFPYMSAKQLKGEVVHFRSIDDLPEEAHIDKQALKLWGDKSDLDIPLFAGSNFLGSLTFNSVEKEIDWPEDIEIVVPSTVAPSSSSRRNDSPPLMNGKTAPESM